MEAFRYGRSLRPGQLRAVHFALDSKRAAHLQAEWEASKARVPLELVDCPDRRLGNTAIQLVSRATEDQTKVTVLRPRRSYSGFLGRLLHDNTADYLARVISRLPSAAATIIPFDTTARLRGEMAAYAVPARSPAARSARRVDDATTAARPAPGQPYSAEGTVQSVQVASLDDQPVFACEVVDGDTAITALFYGHKHIRGIKPGTRMRLQGWVESKDGKEVIRNPRYELLGPSHGGGGGDEGRLNSH